VQSGRTQLEHQIVQVSLHKMCSMVGRWVFAVLLVSSMSEALSAVRRQDPSAAVSEATEGATQGASKISATGSQVASDTARSLPRVPDAPLPSVTGPPVPLVGSSQPHTADPVVCGLLGGIIVLNWILACCCAGCGAAAAGAEEAEGDTTKAGEAGGICAALFACVECVSSICSICALVYCIMTGLFRAWMGGQAVSGWCLALVVISTLQLILCCCICCCASCGAAILGEATYEKYINQHSKHLMGSHMHAMVHKHKPDGTHPLSEGHLPGVGQIGGRASKNETTPLAQ